MNLQVSCAVSTMKYAICNPGKVRKDKLAGHFNDKGIRLNRFHEPAFHS